MVHADAKAESVMVAVEQGYEGKPTDEELNSLRRVSGKIPMTAYVFVLCGILRERILLQRNRCNL